MQPTQHSLRIHHVLIGIVLSLGVWMATVGVLSYDPVPSGIDIAAGRSTFRDHCGACHVLDKGVTMHHGPNFYEIGKVAGTRKPDLTAAEYILESILEPRAFVSPENWNGMPKNVAHNLSPDAIRNIVAFLAGRGARPDYKEIQRLEIPDMKQDLPVRVVRRQDMELAEKVLRERGECLNCHSMHRNAEHQVFAPAIFAIGLMDKQLVKESIVDPNKDVAPALMGIKLQLASGESVSGKLISRNDDGLVILARDDQNRPVPMEIAISEIEVEDGQPMIRPSETSAMPTGLDQLLTPKELDALVSMIEQLN